MPPYHPRPPFEPTTGIQAFRKSDETHFGSFGQRCVLRNALCIGLAALPGNGRGNFRELRLPTTRCNTNRIAFVAAALDLLPALLTWRMCKGTTDNGQRITDNGQRTTDNGRWTTDGRRTADENGYRLTMATMVAIFEQRCGHIAF